MFFCKRKQNNNNNITLVFQVQKELEMLTVKTNFFYEDQDKSIFILLILLTNM